MKYINIYDTESIKIFTNCFISTERNNQLEKFVEANKDYHLILYCDNWHIKILDGYTNEGFKKWRCKIPWNE